VVEGERVRRTQGRGSYMDATRPDTSTEWRDLRAPTMHGKAVGEEPDTWGHDAVSDHARW
jgi:hypothetical protein